MNWIALAFTAGLLTLTGVGALAASPLFIAEAGTGASLTLGDAKQLVTKFLNDSGERTLRVGRAEFDMDGNVKVELVTLQGVPLRHVIVDAKSGLVADARTHAPLSKKG